MALIDQAESGELTTRSFARSPGLVLRFRSYGCIVADCWPTRLDIKLPFFHLSNQGFWQPLDAEMRPAKSPDSCVVCEMQPEFIALMSDADFRLKARLVLVTKYFTPTERIALFEGLGLQTCSAKGIKADNVVREAAEAVSKTTGDCGYEGRDERTAGNTDICEGGIWDSYPTPLRASTRECKEQRNMSC